MSFVKLYGTVKWFSPCDQPSNAERLPDAFGESAHLFSAGKEANLEGMVELLSPFLGCRFVAENLNAWEDWFPSENYGEFEADRIKLVGVDFSDDPIPTCKVESWFKIPLLDSVDESSFREWFEENTPSGAIIPYWKIEGIDDDLDFSLGEHSGAEVVIQ